MIAAQGGGVAVLDLRMFDSLRQSNRLALLGALLLLVFAVVLFSRPAAGLSESDFLPPEKAFALSAELVAPDTLELTYQIAPGYYMYHEQFGFESDPPGVVGRPELPRGQVIFDPIFEKDLETHRDRISIRVPLHGAPDAVTLLATSQGCADAGLCYPPLTQKVALDQGAQGGWEVVAADLGREGGNAGEWGAWLTANDVSLADALVGSALWQTAGVFFVLGVLLSLTPCVLPMVPILSSILVGDSAVQVRSRRMRGLGLAAVYVLGMSLVYTAAGVAAGLTGASLAATLQTPWVLITFALLLAILALAMFDVFTVQVPGGVQARLSAWANRLPGGRFTGAFGMGAISALIVGPCVAAPLAGALLYISQTGDVWVGAVALFALAWGMGVLLLVAGASAGALLPKAGAWMDGVKRFFGMLLLVVAWWTLLPVLPGWVQMAGWALLALFAASLLRAFDSLPAEARIGRRFTKGLGWAFALIGVVEVVGLASGGRDPLQPLAHLAAVQQTAAPSPSAYVGAPQPREGHASAFSDVSSSGSTAASTDSSFIEGSNQNGYVFGSTASSAGAGGLSFASRVTADGVRAVPGAPGVNFLLVNSLGQLNDVIKQARGRPVMLDFYADWCVSCKEMERFTFSQPEVAQRMGQMVLVQADVTKNSPEHQALLKRFRLFGPPGIIFFDANGNERTDARVIGFQNAQRFSAVLDTVLAGG